MEATSTLIAAALKDAKAAGPGITIYEDDYEGGLAWKRHEDDYTASGPIGYDPDDYGPRYDADDEPLDECPEYGDRIATVKAALRDAGYEVA